MIIESAPAALRGELCRWMIELKPGVFIAKVSGLVRDALWEKVKESLPFGNALMINNSSSELGFDIKMHGMPTRSVVDLDGLQLIKFQQ